MASVTVDDPDIHKTDMKVDDRGRVYVGTELAGQRVTVTIEVEDNE